MLQAYCEHVARRYSKSARKVHFTEIFYKGLDPPPPPIFPIKKLPV